MASEPNPYDQLAEAAARVAAARAADKDAFLVAALAGGGAFLWLSASGNLGEPWAVLAIVIAFAGVYRIAKVMFYRQRGLGQLQLFGSLLPSSVTLTDGPAAGSQTKTKGIAAVAPQEPRSAAVMRLPFTRTPPDTAVVLADLRGLETLRAGRANAVSEDLPLGVLMVTSGGLAFLPEARDHLENLLGDIPGALVGEFASQLLPPVEYLQGWKDVHEVFNEPPPLSEWMDVALRQKHAFVIAWGDLIDIKASPASTWLLRKNDTEETSFRLMIDGSDLVTALMQARLAVDLRATVAEFVFRPKFEELLPQVEAELVEAMRGQDEGSLQTQARNEAFERTSRWFSETEQSIEGIVKEKMQAALEGYARLPEVVACQPWLFAPDGTARMQ